MNKHGKHNKPIITKATSFPSNAFDSGSINIPETINLKQSSVVYPPDKKYYIIKTHKTIQTHPYYSHPLRKRFSL